MESDPAATNENGAPLEVRRDRDLLQLVSEERLSCVKCGYLLGSLESCRCPECSRGFTFADWPTFAFSEEIATMVRLRGPVSCERCHALISTNTDGRCPFCSRRIRRVDVPGEQPAPLHNRDIPRAARFAIAGMISVACIAILATLVTFWIDGTRPPSRSVLRTVESTAWGQWWLIALSSLGGLLLAIVIPLTAQRVPLRETPCFRLLLSGPRWFALVLAGLSWSIVGVFVAGAFVLVAFA